MWQLAITLVLAVATAELQPGECPAGHVLVPGSMIQTPLENGEIDVRWDCKLAQKQLSDMGTGKVDTGTGFDGGIGPSSAVATAALAAGIPEPTPEQLERYSKNPGIMAAAGEAAKAGQQAKAAQTKADALREKQKALSVFEPNERQKLQIEIANAERERIAARGAERIAAERMKRLTIVLDAHILMNE